MGENAAPATEVNDGAFPASGASKFLGQSARRVVRDAAIPGVVNVGQVSSVRIVRWQRHSFAV
jgi:hypothetical protein